MGDSWETHGTVMGDSWERLQPGLVIQARLTVSGRKAAFWSKQAQTSSSVETG